MRHGIVKILSGFRSCRTLDNLTGMEAGNGIGVIAERTQHLIGVGAEGRGHVVKPAAAMAELEAAAGETKTAIGRVDLLNGLACRYLRVIDPLLALPDAGAGRARRIEDLLPLARVPG